MLPRKPKISYRYLKSGIEEFHSKFVLVPADKAANNVVVVWRLHYINTLKQELGGTKAYEQTSEKEKSVINNHIFHNATRFAVSVNEDRERLPTFYWLPKLHRKTYKARFIANSSSCTTTELSKLLTFCLTTIKNALLNIMKKSMKGPVKICFGQSEIHVRYSISWNLEVSVRPVCLHTIFLHYILPCPTILLRIN